MTRNKHVKQRIRSRMEKTGERYTTARRSIVADTPPPVDMEGTDAPADPARWHHAGTVAGATALRVLLSAAGIRDPRTGQPLSEAMVFGLAGGIGIGVFGFVYEAADFASLFIGGRHLWQDDDTYLRRAAARLGVELEVHEGSPRATDAALHAILASGRPAIAFVEAGLLPHRRMPEAMLGGGYHLVTVYGMEADHALIGDLATQPIAVPAGEFAAARSRIRKQRNRIVAITAARNPHELGAAAREALAACVSGLEGADAIGGSTRNFSLLALDDLARRIDGRGRDSWASTLPPGRRAWSVLTMLADFVELRTSGLCRPLFAAYLAEVDDFLPGAAALANGFAALGREWSALAEAALPSAVPGFARARLLRDERAALRGSGEPGAMEAVVSLDGQLAAIDAEMADCFPLAETQYAALRAVLHVKVGALYQHEERMHEELQQLLRAARA